MAVDQRGWLWAVSLAAHGGIALAMGSVRPAPQRRDPVVVTIRAARVARPQSVAPPPASTPAPAPIAPAAPRVQSSTPTTPARRAARASTPPPPVAAPSASSSAGAAPDFGLTMGNGPGLAVAAGGGAAGEAPAPRAAPRAAVEAPATAPACAEEAQRARPIELAQPEYPEAAREAAIEGRVRVEVSIDEQGRVSSARVIQSLGHGCDEAALEVARAARFAPATRCGSAVRSTLTIGIRFSL